MSYLDRVAASVGLTDAGSIERGYHLLHGENFNTSGAEKLSVALESSQQSYRSSPEGKPRNMFSFNSLPTSLYTGQAEFCRKHYVARGPLRAVRIFENMKKKSSRHLKNATLNSLCFANLRQSGPTRSGRKFLLSDTTGSLPVFLKGHWQSQWHTHVEREIYGSSGKCLRLLPDSTPSPTARWLNFAEDNPACGACSRSPSRVLGRS